MLRLFQLNLLESEMVFSTKVFTELRLLYPYFTLFFWEQNHNILPEFN